MAESRFSEASNESVLPKKEQWALIYQHRAKEFERAKSMEKLMSQQKKELFKSELDRQLTLKHNLQKDEKEEDRRYYDYITSKAQQMKEQEEKEKFRRFLLSKQMEEQNKKVMENHVDPKLSEAGKIYNIDIGVKSEQEKRERAEQMRRNVIETLDRQRQEKEAERRAKLQQEQLLYRKNEDYQNQMFLNRNGNSRKYEQNQKVYNYYRDLYQQKVRKDQDLQHKLVHNVQAAQEQLEAKKKHQESIEKERKNGEMKDTLQQQLELLHRRKEEEHRTNPEQASYSFISNIFRDKKPTYDKREYSLFLDRQSQEQRLNKLSQKYMNEEEYRYNSNQLNKAITGNYTFDRYHDRSVNNIGDRLNLSTRAMEPVRIEDAELVKTKLEYARSQGRGRAEQGGSNSPLGTGF